MSGKTHLDIQALVEDWAWDYFRRKANRKEKKLLDQEYITMEIDWKKVRFVHEDPVYQPEPPKAGTGKPINNTLFYTTFSNKTDRPQKYTFRTERQSTSLCTIHVEKGYTVGVETSVKITTPCNIFEANVGFKHEMTLVNCEEQTVEEHLTWGVDSEVEVEGRHRAEAKLIIMEEEYKGSFTVSTKVSGRVRAVFFNIRDNNSFIKAVESEIDQIASNASKDRRIPGELMVVDGATKTVILTTKGQCKFKYGLKQDVEVDQIPLD